MKDSNAKFNPMDDASLGKAMDTHCHTEVTQRVVTKMPMNTTALPRMFHSGTKNGQEHLSLVSLKHKGHPCT